MPVTHPLLQIPEIAPDESEILFSQQICHRVGILVKAVEPATATQAFKNLAAMSPSAEGCVYISASGLNAQTVDALLK
jgi:hypothetical protein